MLLPILQLLLIISASFASPHRFSLAGTLVAPKGAYSDCHYHYLIVIFIIIGILISIRLATAQALEARMKNSLAEPTEAAEALNVLLLVRYMGVSHNLWCLILGVLIGRILLYIRVLY